MMGGSRPKGRPYVKSEATTTGQRRNGGLLLDRTREGKGREGKGEKGGPSRKRCERALNARKAALAVVPVSLSRRGLRFFVHEPPIRILEVGKDGGVVVGQETPPELAPLRSWHTAVLPAVPQQRAGNGLIDCWMLRCDHT